MKNSKTQHLGRLNAHHVLEISLYVRPRRILSGWHDVGKLRQFRHLSHKDFARHYGADECDLRKVAQFAHKMGLLITRLHKGQRCIHVSGTVAQLEKAFGVELHHYRKGNHYHHTHTEQLRPPEDLKDILTGIFGLNSQPIARPYVRAFANRDASTSFSPLELADLYAFPNGYTGKGQCVAMLELGGAYSAKDLEAYLTSLNLNVPFVSVVSVNGAVMHSTRDNQEVMLDIEVASAIAPDAQYLLYFAPNTYQGFLDGVNQIIHDEERKPGILSISWGFPESGADPQFLLEMNLAFQAAAAMGMTVLAAAGDYGSVDGVGDGKPHVDFPASSPYVLATGGTRLEAKDGVILSETVWNNLPQLATGGGGSAVFVRPPWQAGCKVPKSAAGSEGRGVPDLAMVADPHTGYQVLVNGENTVVGGTSAAAPLLAGLIARVAEAIGRRPGFLNPLLYQAAVHNSNLFRDIVAGSNGAYSAAPGWDPCTGWGSVNGTQLLEAVKAPPYGLSTSLPALHLVPSSSSGSGAIRPHAASSLPTGCLVPCQSHDDQSAVGAAYAIITTQAEAIKQQSSFPAEILVGAPSLNTHLTTLQGHAETWLSKYYKDVLNTLQLTIGYNNKFQNFYGALSNLAAAIGTGNNKAQFQQGLTLLRITIDANKAAVDEVAQEISTYRQDLESSVSEMTDDLQKAQSYLGSKGILKTGNVLFTIDSVTSSSQYILDLNANKVSDGLKSTFTQHQISLDGSLVLNNQIADQEWALCCVSYNRDGSYKLNQPYVLEYDDTNHQLQVYLGSGGEIANLQARYDADQDAMRRDLAYEISGPIATFVGLFIIVVGALAELPSGGLSTGLIVGGVVGVGGGLAMTVIGGLDYANKQSDASECLRELAKDEQLQAILPHQINSARSFLSGVKSAEAAVVSLSTAWANLSNKMQTLHDALTQVSPEDGAFIQSELDTAKADWEGVTTQANNILTNLSNRPPTVVLQPGDSLSSDNPSIQAAAKAWIDANPPASTPVAHASAATIDDKNYFTSSAFEDVMRASFADWLLLTATSSNILNQQRINLNLVPTLSDTQVGIQTDIGLYLNQFFMQQMAAYSQIGGFDAAISAMAVIMKNAAKDWDSNSSNAGSFKFGLQKLRNYAQNYVDETSAFLQDLKNFKNFALTKDMNVYANDLELALKTIRSDTKVLQANLQSLSTKLEESNARIALGASTQVLKMTEFSIDIGMAVAEVPEIGSLLVDTTFSYIDDAVGGEADPEDSLKYIKEYREALQCLLNEQAQIGVLKTLSLNLNRFSNCINQMISTSIPNVINAWKAVIDNLYILSCYSSGSGLTYFEDQYSGAIDAWTALNQRAEQYLDAMQNVSWEASNAK